MDHSSRAVPDTEQSNVLKFVFALRVIAHNPAFRERRSSQGNWLPSKEFNYNVARAIDVPGEGNLPFLLFAYDGSRNPPTQRILGLPNGSQEHNTYSLYHARSRFLLVNFDATRNRVGDGVESGAHSPPRRVRVEDQDSDDEDDDNYDNWVELSFARLEDDPENERYSISRAAARQEHGRLAGHHSNQGCIQHFLPDRYHSREAVQDQRYGGLVGDLALLIAIVAMSQPSHLWAPLIPHAIQNPWQVSQLQLTHVNRASAWLDKRGVMATVMTVPGGSSAEQLEEVEQGSWGAILK